MTQQQTKEVVTVIGEDKFLDTLQENIIKDAPESEEYQILKQDLVNVINNFKGVTLYEGLRKKFGDKDWKVKMEHYAKPFIASSSKSEYRYVVKSIEWKGGPNSHQVFFFLKENYKYYLKDLDFNENLFARTLPDIEKRFTSFFVPLDINGVKFNGIAIRMREIVEGSVTYFSISAKDDQLGLKDIKGDTRAEALTKFQERIESHYYREKMEGDYHKEKGKEDGPLKSFHQRLLSYKRDAVPVPVPIQPEAIGNENKEELTFP